MKIAAIQTSKGETTEIESNDCDLAKLLDLLIAHVRNKGATIAKGQLAHAIALRVRELHRASFELLLDLGPDAMLLSFREMPAKALTDALASYARRYLDGRCGGPPAPLNKNRVLALLKLAPECVTQEMRELIKGPSNQQIQEAQRAAAIRGESNLLLDKIQAFCADIARNLQLATVVREQARTLQEQVAARQTSMAAASIATVIALYDAVTLHTALLVPLQALVAILREDPYFHTTQLARSEAPSAWLEPKLLETRRKVNAALLSLAQAVLALDPSLDCRLCYRGSLTDATRNATKSISLQHLVDAVLSAPGATSFNFTQTVTEATRRSLSARVINLNSFDVDAFVEVPNGVWDEWVQNKFVPALGAQKKKISLTDMVNHMLFFKKTPEQFAMLNIPLNRAQAGMALGGKLEELEREMRRAQSKLSSIAGYKRNGDGEIDFSLIIQPARTTHAQVQRGKPYPVGQLDHPLSLHRGREILLKHDRTPAKALVAVLPDVPVTVPYHPDGMAPRRGRANSLPVRVGAGTHPAALPATHARHAAPAQGRSVAILPRQASPSVASRNPVHLGPTIAAPPRHVVAMPPASVAIAPPRTAMAVPALTEGMFVDFIAGGINRRLMVSATLQNRGEEFYAREEPWNPITRYWTALKYRDYGVTWRLAG
jgi:hypothetical protein